MAKRVAGGRHTTPAWTCRRCGSGRVVELHLGGRHAGLCADCDMAWGDQLVLDVVARHKAAG